MPRVALVSGADANYYPLLREWIHSVRRFPESANHDICILDAGLTDAQIVELSPLVTSIVRPDWPPGLPPSKTKGQEYLKACVCRPFIPQMFPGYEVYMWMDSDTWVQDWSAVEMFLRCAAERPDRIVLTSNADRAYARQVRIKWLGPWPYKIGSFYYSNGKKAFGGSVARKLLPEYVLSAGCFAIAASAPHWARWQQLVSIAATNGKIFPAEQLSLGHLVYLDGFKAELLPAYTHWLCVRPPLWDAQRQLFVEPFFPHQPLGVLHLSGVDAMRADRTVTATFQTTDGQSIRLNFRYPHFDAGPLTVTVPVRA